MKKNSTMNLFMLTMAVGVVLTLSSNNMLMLWVGLELSMISYIPMMTTEGASGGESSIKYFIVQSVSSCMLILGMLFMLMHNLAFDYFMVISLSIKVGLAPFHSWVLSLVEGLNYTLLFILLTIMKISPIFIMSLSNFDLTLMVILTLLIGSISGLNQNSIRKMLAYSSIYNLGFIFSVVYLNSMWSVYLFMYMTVLLTVILLMKFMNINYLNQLLLNNFDQKNKVILWICMLSMGGMPPMLGFLNKIIIFEVMILHEYYFTLLIMILSSLMVMFFYIRISLISVVNFSATFKWNFFLSSPMNYSLGMINLLLFPVFILIKSIL
uniref:NADH-ubiquinone oxidoreductase chain 2 n=1 Tax=Concaveplana hamulusa TaxID=3092773 RepID=A0AAF1C2D8_9HEMI|nr:NADH dehydrogenase subunit 2 [Concaveplana hamulusa]WPC85247.1 NADH dehydrogenase subunit 2 [Concaveplana hamulusa]